MSKRSAERHTKRLDVRFEAGGSSYAGITSNLSKHGMFIRTMHGFVPGTTVNIELTLPDSSMMRLQGRVRRTFKTSISAMKNGMGIELIEPCPEYLSFIEAFD